VADADSLWTSPKTILSIVVALTGVAGLVVTIYLHNRDSGKSTPHVADVTLTARVRQFSERCPATFDYDGAITVDRGSGTVTYRFIHRDGLGQEEVQEPVKTAQVDGPRTVPVRYQWTANIPVGAISRTVTLEVLSPVSDRSPGVTVSGYCDANAPPSPPTPPPEVPGGPPSG
jgi:hypothetical protein